ncbi:hypothetical protein LCGC14_2350540 [marine sediment metagenome]|uniref:Uncharacterized protein n=1 Tax=marine sediment metagenome TaxID=412755 RepID=A0A0F9C986_9ZZZZ
MFENDEAELLAAKLEADVGMLTSAIEDGDVTGAREILTRIEGIAKALRTELDSLPVATGVGDPEGG